MARNGSGTYSKVNTFIAGNTITAAGHNTNWDDLVLEMTNSVAADGQTTITAPLKGANGSQAAPAYTFAADLDCGVWRIGADNIGIGVGNTKMLDISTTAVTVAGQLNAGIAGLNIIGATQLTAPANGDTLPIYDLSATANARILLSDFFKVINDFAADASPDISADYVVTYDTSAAAAKKVLLASIPSNLPRGYIDGCVLSNGTDTTNDINITAGSCRDSTNAVDIVVSANTSGKQLDANWAVSGTTNSGMRNSAAGIANSTYHIYAARTAASSTATIYAIAGVDGTDPDSSAAITTMLTALQTETGGASYIYARRLGSILRESAAIVQFAQVGDLFRRRTPSLDMNNATLTTSSQSFALSVPSGLVLTIDYNFMSGSSSASLFYIRNPSDTDSAPSATAAPGFTIRDTTLGGGAGGGGQFHVTCNSSRQIAARADGSATASYLTTLAWTDQRGKNAA